MSHEQQFYLSVLSEDADPEEIAELARRLRRELLEVDVEDVEFAKGADLPAGAKSLGSIDWGTLILTVAGSGTAAFVGVKLALSSFLQRHPHTILVIERPDGTLITLEGEFRPGTPLYDQFLVPAPATATPSPSAEPTHVTGDEIQRLVEILTGLSEFRRPNSRYDTVEGWLTDSPRERDLVMILDLEGAPHIAARRLVQKLVEFGQDTAGHEALGWVVKGLLKEPGLGEEKRPLLHTLLPKLDPYHQQNQPSSQPIPPSPQPATASTQNFDILIGPRNGEGAYAVRVIGSPAGENPNPTYQPLPYESIEKALLYVENLVAQEQDMEMLGRTLFDFLFPPSVKAKFDQSQPREGEGVLRVRLRWDSVGVLADLVRLPWEYIHDGRDFLAHKRTLSLTRFLHDNAPASLTAPETLRILAVSAAPTNLPPLKELDKQQELLTAAIAGQSRIALKTVAHVTRGQLREAIADFNPHVLHFDGHGRITAESGALALEGDGGLADYVTAQELRVLLNSGPVRLAVLNGCVTAAQPTDRDAAVQGVAAQLVAAGLPAVVGMQYALPDRIAPTFMRALYRGLAANKPLDQTLTEARIALYFDHKDKNFWALPALYLRVDDGRVFG